MNVQHQNKSVLGAAAAMAAAIMAFSCTTPAIADSGAADYEEFNTAVESSLQRRLDEIASQNNLNAEFSDIQIKATRATIDEYHGDADAYAAAIMKAYEEDTGLNTTQATIPRRRGAATYTSSVFAGVPAGGACLVKQDFRATVTNYKVTSKSMLGSSYQTGICVFKWTPNYSWFEGNLNVLSKGTFHAVIKGGPVSFSSTFEAFFHTNKSSLYQEFQ